MYVKPNAMQRQREGLTSLVGATVGHHHLERAFVEAGGERVAGYTISIPIDEKPMRAWFTAPMPRRSAPGLPSRKPPRFVWSGL